MGPTAGDVDSDAVAGYVLTGDGAAGMSIGLDNHVGDALLRKAIERPHGDRTVVIKNSVLPKTIFAASGVCSELFKAFRRIANAGHASTPPVPHARRCPDRRS